MEKKLKSMFFEFFFSLCMCLIGIFFQETLILAFEATNSAIYPQIVPFFSGLAHFALMQNFVKFFLTHPLL